MTANPVTGFWAGDLALLVDELPPQGGYACWRELLTLYAETPGLGPKRSVGYFAPYCLLSEI